MLTHNEEIKKARLLIRDLRKMFRDVNIFGKEKFHILHLSEYDSDLLSFYEAYKNSMGVGFSFDTFQGMEVKWYEEKTQIIPIKPEPDKNSEVFKKMVEYAVDKHFTRSMESIRRLAILENLKVLKEMEDIGLFPFGVTKVPYEGMETVDEEVLRTQLAYEAFRDKMQQWYKKILGWQEGIEKPEPEGMTFSEAIQALGNDRAVKRKSWLAGTKLRKYNNAVEICVVRRWGTWAMKFEDFEATDWIVVQEKQDGT